VRIAAGDSLCLLIEGIKQEDHLNLLVRANRSTL
jgi:hypothetical protein